MVLLISCARQVCCPRASSLIQRTCAVRKFGVSPDLRGAQVRCFSRLALCARRVFLRTCAYTNLFFRKNKKKNGGKRQQKTKNYIVFSIKEGKKGEHTLFLNKAARKYLTSVQSPSPHLAQPSLLLLVLLRLFTPTPATTATATSTTRSTHAGSV